MDAFGGSQPHSEPGVTHRGTEGTWPQMGPHLGALRVGRRTGGGSAGGRGSMRSVCLCTDGWLCTPQTRASHSGVHPKHAHMSSAESHSTMNPPPQPSCMADVTISVAQPRHRQLTLCTHTHTHKHAPPDVHPPVHGAVGAVVSACHPNPSVPAWAACCGAWRCHGARVGVKLWGGGATPRGPHWRLSSRPPTLCHGQSPLFNSAVEAAVGLHLHRAERAESHRCSHQRGHSRR